MLHPTLILTEDKEVSEMAQMSQVSAGTNSERLNKTHMKWASEMSERSWVWTRAGCTLSMCEALGSISSTHPLKKQRYLKRTENEVEKKPKGQKMA